MKVKKIRNYYVNGKKNIGNNGLVITFFFSFFFNDVIQYQKLVETSFSNIIIRKCQHKVSKDDIILKCEFNIYV